MHIESSITAVSWIPVGSVTGPPGFRFLSA